MRPQRDFTAAFASSNPATLMMQSAANRSPLQISLLTGKLTGNFAESGHSTPIFASDQHADPTAYSRIPYEKEQGISEQVLQ
jgi:hypothetical protein